MDAIRSGQTSQLRPSKKREPGTLGEQEHSESEEQSGDQFQDSLHSEDNLDEQEEQAEGDRHEDELLEKYPLWLEPEAEDLLLELEEQLRPQMRRPELEYRFQALDAEIPFASSCPNGAIYFTRAFLENLSFEDIAFFAAHELAHTELHHYASRRRRLSELRQLIPAPIGSPSRLRLDNAAVLTVRHQEEFEADFQAVLWQNKAAGIQALEELLAVCQDLCPESLNSPTHPAFEKRIEAIKKGEPFPQSLTYLYSLVG